jgi:hypothetical protein
MTSSVYGSSPIKRRRRTGSEIGPLKEIIFQEECSNDYWLW